MTKPLLAALALASTALISLSFKGPADDPIYKNLKVLPKNITKHQMDSVMHHFSASLSVRCNFCHVRNDSTKTWDFAADDNKHKLIAREMMTMTDKINDKYFDMGNSKRDLNTKLMVTCYTCHHGETDPATIPPMPPMNERPRDQRPPADTIKRN